MNVLRLTLLAVACFGVTAAAQSPHSAGMLTGTVTDASSGLPVPGAEVAVPSLSKITTTNDKGEFRLADVPSGVQGLRVRRIGYMEFTTQVSVPAQGAVERKVVLRRVQTLTPVEVSADPTMASFEENRRIGLGKFVTRAELERMEHLKLAEVLFEKGIRSVRKGHHAWVGGQRGPKSFSPKCVHLEGGGPDCKCFAQVYLNDALLYNGEKEGLVPDIQMILPQSLEGIEYYASAAQTPMRYSRLNSQCGVLVLHTRRTMGSTKDKP